MGQQRQAEGDVTNAPGLRELKRSRLTAQLEDTAIAVFSENGYSTTPVDVVAERLQVSPRTVYRYFPLKEDLVLSAERRVHAEGLRRISLSPPDEAALTSLNKLITFFEQRLVDRQSREFAFHTLVTRTPELASAYLGVMNQLETEIATALENRAGFSEIRSSGWSGPLLAAALTTAHRIAVNAWIDDAPGSSLPNMVRRNFALLSTSLSGVPGWVEIVDDAAQPV